MEHEVKLRIILENPIAGVDFGLQKGSGNNYETIQTQRSAGGNLFFDFSARVKCTSGKAPVFLGPFSQGSVADRFVYIDIGSLAGQKGTHWSRRLKIPMNSITKEMIHQSLAGPDGLIVTMVPGTGKDGGPNCGTVKPFGGWKLSSHDQ